MKIQEIQDAMKILHLTKEEMAELMGLGIRQVHRWFEGKSKISNACHLLLKCWLRFHELGIPWRHEAVKNILNLESEDA